jgi:hypothetical protein
MHTRSRVDKHVARLIGAIAPPELRSLGQCVASTAQRLTIVNESVWGREAPALSTAVNTAW